MRGLIIPRSGGTATPLEYKGKIIELEGLRGIAILMVTIHHFWPETGEFFQRWSSIAHFGWIGVDLFFVISGFLIGGILLDTREDSRYFSNFYARRILRIFPLYYAVVLSLFLVVPTGQALIHGLSYMDSGFIRESGSPLWYLLFAGNIREAITGTEPAYFLAPLWSVSIEEQFYLLCPLLIRNLSITGLKRLLLGIMVFSPLFRMAMYFAFPDNERIQYLATLSRFDNLSAGVWLALMARSGIRIPGRALTALLAALICIGMLIFANGGFDRHTFFCRVFGYSFLPLLFSVAVLWALRYRGGAMPAFLRMRWLVYLGGLCYGLYMLQRPAEIALTKSLLLLSFDLEQHALLSLVAKTLFAVFVSHLSFRLFESPINRLKHRFASTHHPMMQAPADTGESTNPGQGNMQAPSRTMA